MDVPYRLITISSTTCSGSSTLADQLSKALGWPQFNTVSGIVRDYLSSHNLTMIDIGKVPDEVHIAADDSVKTLLAKESQKIYVGRTTGWMANAYPNIFKIFIDASYDVRAQRFAQREHLSEERARQQLAALDVSNWERYARLYHIDPREPKWYDLLLDTTHTPPDLTVAAVLSALQSAKK